MDDFIVALATTPISSRNICHKLYASDYNWAKTDRRWIKRDSAGLKNIDNLVKAGRLTRAGRGIVVAA